MEQHRQLDNYHHAFRFVAGFGGPSHGAATLSRQQLKITTQQKDKCMAARSNQLNRLAEGELLPQIEITRSVRWSLIALRAYVILMIFL
jgi:hypothetical protein